MTQDIEWYKNVEYIFTTEELNDFCKQKRLQKVKIINRNHYIKYGCVSDFKEQMKKEDF